MKEKIHSVDAYPLSWPFHWKRAKEMVQASFTDFQALPDYTVTAIQYFEGVADGEHLQERYLHLAKELHPDVGGSSDDFAEMQRQYERRQQELKQ